MTFLEAVKTVIRKTFVIQGRASRSEYWYWRLFMFLFYPASVCFVSIIMTSISKDNGSLAFLFGIIFGAIFSIPFYLLLTLIPITTVGIRRMHDIGRSALWCLLDFIPRLLVLSFSLFVIMKMFDQNSNSPFNFVSDIPSWIKMLIFFICPLIFLALCTINSQPNDNKYGENPNALQNTENTSE